MNYTHKLERYTLPQRMAKGLLWLGGTRVAIQAVSWFTMVYVARLLSPSDYGLMGMALLFVGFLRLFNELGIGTAIIQKKTLDENEVHSVFWIILATNIALFSIRILMSSLVSDFFEEPQLRYIIRACSVIILVNCIGIIPYNMLTRNMSFDRRSQAELIGTLAGSISMLLFAAKGFGVWSLVYGSIILEVSNNLLMFIFQPHKPSLYFSFMKAKQIIVFGLHMLLARILWYFSSKADVFAGGKLLGKAQLGYYSLAFQFAAIPLDKIVALVTQVALPAFSQIQDDEERLRKYFQRTLAIISCITFPISAGIIVLADEAVNILLTEKWHLMIFPLKILSIVSCMKAVESLNATLVVAKGQPRLVVMFNALGAIILPISFFLGAVNGLNGLAISWLVGFPIIFFYTTTKATRLINMSLTKYFFALKHYVFSALIMAILVSFVKSSLLQTTDLLRVTITAPIGFTFYIIYHAIFNRKIFTDLKTILLKK